MDEKWDDDLTYPELTLALQGLRDRAVHIGAQKEGHVGDERHPATICEVRYHKHTLLQGGETQGGDNGTAANKQAGRR